MQLDKVLCPDCNGDGITLVARLYPDGYTECWDECEFCGGSGSFDEDDFIIMKLEGSV